MTWVDYAIYGSLYLILLIGVILLFKNVNN